MPISRKDFLLNSLKFGFGGLGISFGSGLLYSYFANVNYKKDFPYLPENKVNLKQNGKSVLILGAGLAGLQAGCELVDRGFKVTILEKTSYAGGKLKAWKDVQFAKRIFKDKPYTREHGLHGVWGFYKNLREFLGRHNISLNKLNDEDSFYYFVSKDGIQNKIETPTWAVPFDRFQMKNRGLYIPSVENINEPTSGQLKTFLASLKLWGFDYSSQKERSYLDKITFYDWAKKQGISEQYIKHYFDGLSEMGFFMKTNECSALAIANFIKLGSLPTDSRVDYYKWPPDETFITPMVNYIRSKGGVIEFNSEVSELEIKNTRITSVKVNSLFPKKKFKKCRVCGNIMDASHNDDCPFCGAHSSELEILTLDDSKIKSYTADHIITAMDLPGAKKIISTTIPFKEEYFEKILKLSTAVIFCVNLLYENSDAWEKRFPSKEFWNAHDFFPTGFKVLGFTSNWASKQIPLLKENKADLIEVQVSDWKQFSGMSNKEIAKKVHEELKLVIPELPEFTEFYINKWDNYTGHRPGDEGNRPEIQSPIENLYFIGDWVYIPHHAVFMEKTNVTAKMITNLILDKEKLPDGKITILKSGTPDWQIDLLSKFTSVES